MRAQHIDMMRACLESTGAWCAVGCGSAAERHLHEAALTRADSLQDVAVLGLDEQAVVLLVLGAPDLQHRHRLVAQLYLGHSSAE